MFESLRVRNVRGLLWTAPIRLPRRRATIQPRPTDRITARAAAASLVVIGKVRHLEENDRYSGRKALDGCDFDVFAARKSQDSQSSKEG